MNERIDADINSQQRTRRETCLNLSDEDSAHKYKIDTDEGIDPSDEHRQVVHALRGFSESTAPQTAAAISVKCWIGHLRTRGVKHTCIACFRRVLSDGGCALPVCVFVYRIL